MSSEKGLSRRGFAIAAGTAAWLIAASARVETIVDEWSSVQAPRPPAPKVVSVGRRAAHARLQSADVQHAATPRSAAP